MNKLQTIGAIGSAVCVVLATFLIAPYAGDGLDYVPRVNGVLGGAAFVGALIFVLIFAAGRMQGQDDSAPGSRSKTTATMPQPLQTANLDPQPQQASQARQEMCENCGRAIGKLETPQLWQEHVVCAECKERLQKQA